MIVPIMATRGHRVRRLQICPFDLYYTDLLARKSLFQKEDMVG